MTTCTQCHASFNVTQSDREFYLRFDSPEPTLCPDCRQQRRLTYRNERKLYKRTCDFTKKSIVSIYSQDKPCTVYDQEVWWSDKWDPMQYGREFDFNKTFFEQFHELSLVVPRPCIVNMSSENSLYTNHSAYNKNCYMCINTGYSEDLLYCTNYNLYNQDCTDSLGIQNCEMCYFCVNTKASSFSSYLYECMNCVSSAFLYDCRDCQDCFGCWNLRKKRYCIFNVQYTKEEYEKKIKEFTPQTWAQAKNAFTQFTRLLQEKALHRGSIIDNCEESVGDHIAGTNKVYNSFYTFDSQDCSYCYDCGVMKVARDVTEPFKGELQLETHGCNLGYDLMACSKCYECNKIRYSQYCWYSSNLFGCFGLKRKEYCILNKQYSADEYGSLTKKIIEHMKKTKEWGEFFPSSLSPFGYNETAAQEYYPITKEVAAKSGWSWKEDEQRSAIPQSYEIPDAITKVNDDILSEILCCTECKKNYRIISEELAFYKKSNLPIPASCSDCRYRSRMDLRPARALTQRSCTLCTKEIYSVYPKESLVKNVLCEECYKKSIYG